MVKTVAILTGGGDVPGLNPCIKSFVMGALEEGYNVLGIRRGWAGLLHYDKDEPATHSYYILDLDEFAVRTIDRTGGTFLHTSRTNPQKVKEQDIPDFLLNSKFGKSVSDKGLRDYTDHILDVLDHLNIDVLVTIGGDDTLGFSSRLTKEGFPTIGIPKTMDNDVYGTDYCIGFSTAVSRSVDLITNMRSTVGSHERIGVIELFGRNSGETSLISAYLAHVDRAIISEVPFDIEKLTAFLLADKDKNPSNYAIMTISEGSRIIGGEIIETGEADAFGHRKLGGIGEIVSEEIKKRSKYNTMYQKLGYLMRAGPPDSLDRMVAMCFGNLALQLLNKSQFGKMVSLQDGKYTTFPLDQITTKKRCADIDAYYDVEKYRPKIKKIMGLPMFLT